MHDAYFSTPYQKDTLEMASLSLSGSFGIQPFSQAVQIAKQGAITRTLAMSQQAGGDRAGLSMLASTAAAPSLYGTGVCMNDPTTRVQCLNAKANDACYGNQPDACMYISRLQGAVMEDMIQAQLAANRHSDVDAYFLSPTSVTVPKYTSNDTAAVSVATSTL